MSSEESARQMYDALKIEDRSFKEVWALHSSDELKLCWVTNTTGVERFFLAENAELALYVAVANGDLRHVRNGHSRLVSRDYLDKNPAFASAVEKAIRAGKLGALTRLEDDCVCVGPVHAGAVIYTPLHLV